MLLVTALVTGCGPGKGKTTLNARFVDHPNGGDYVSRVEAQVTLSRDFTDQSGLFQTTPEPERITVDVEWIASAFDGTNPQVFYSDQVVVDRKSVTKLYWYEASASDEVLVGDWYLRLSWRDDEGREEVTSQVAVCRNPPLSSSGRIARRVVKSNAPSSANENR